MARPGVGLQFRGKITEADRKDVGNVIRKKSYWVKLVLGNLYGFCLLAAIVVATIAALVSNGDTKPNWAGIGVIWLVLGAILAWLIQSTKRKLARELVRLNAALPDWINVGDDGVKFEGPNGAKAFHPWSSFTRFREGRRVMVLDQYDGKQVVMLPVSDLSEVERQTIRQYLQSHIQPSHVIA